MNVTPRNLDRTNRIGPPPGSSNILDAQSLDPADDPIKSEFADVPQSAGLNLGHYDVQEVLGRGGFGVVLKAFDRKLERLVAIKLMNAEMAATSPARKRFLREARAAAAVRHENVVQIYTVEEGPPPYLVMEYIPGGSLQDRLQSEGPLPVDAVLDISTQIARGLAAAHAMNLVHRDIKPANILLKQGSDTPVRITDFGLARAADDASLSQSGTVAGTPMYMAPEQACGESFDHRADLFSLGSVMYQMVTGRPPFRAPSSVAVLKRVVEETPRPIAEIIPETPDWLIAVITTLHQKKAVDRFQSAREVADVLAKYRDEYRADGTIRRTRLVTNPTGQPLTFRRTWTAIAAGTTLAIGLALVFLLGTFSPKRSVIEPSVQANSADRFTNAIGMTFVRIPAGRAWLGGGADEPGTAENFPEDFFLSKYELTQGQWNALMPTNPSVFQRHGKLDLEVADLSDEDIARLPVDSMSRLQASEFIAQLNQKHPDPGWVYRLPTQKEWEYACRGGPMTSPNEGAFDFYFSQPTNTIDPAMIIFKDSRPVRTRIVGSLPANKLGLHEMHGNVFEFSHEINDVDQSCKLIGGCWHDPDQFCRASNANGGSIRAAYPGAGIRVGRFKVNTASMP
jgi:eukaryotic-like serine/threonine-protein kinase